MKVVNRYPNQEGSARPDRRRRTPARTPHRCGVRAFFRNASHRKGEVDRRLDPTYGAPGAEAKRTIWTELGELARLWMKEERAFIVTHKEARPVLREELKWHQVAALSHCDEKDLRVITQFKALPEESSYRAVGCVKSLRIAVEFGDPIGAENRGMQPVPARQ